MKKTNLNNSFDYSYLEDKAILNDLNSVKFGKYNFSWLDNKKWRLMPEEDYLNVKKIETIGVPLGKLCDIRVGIATLKDVIYFVEDTGGSYCKANFEGKEFEVEREITKKVIKISSIKEESEIPDDKRRVIFPYKRVGGKFEILEEFELKEKYPKCYEYLLKTKEELAKRDRGKKDYPSWFAWGRSQGMSYHGQRLYTRTFYHKADFMLDNQEDSLFCNGYAIFCKSHPKEMQKILNSNLMNYYIKKTSVEIGGNYQCYQKNFIEKFNLPFFSDSDWSYIESEKDAEKLEEWLIEKYNLDKNLF